MTEPTYQHSLIQAGLAKDQAALYETLLASDALPARTIALKSGVSRTLTYKILDELINMGIIEKRDEPKKVATFTALHPVALKHLIDNKLSAATDAKMALQNVLGNLISQFDTTHGQPGIRIMEGVAGISELYEDILNEGQPILLMRSPLDDTRPDLSALIEKQIREQRNAGIHVRAITPPEQDPVSVYGPQDEANLVERRIVPRDQLGNPAQIVIYGNKVAMTAYEGPLITTIVDNIAIKKTFEMVFEFMWRAIPDEDTFSGHLQH
ncbi:hypothetical protein HZC00_05080 [Candidatus Kaiserbacteria bacterium]|nr:hypothetical protein [Candidatus Kaiserbacteria bacterium]